MKFLAVERVGGLLLLLAMAASAVTMLWLFWRFPIATTIATLMMLAALGIAARLAKLIDTDAVSELDQGEHSV
jgi:hypothetical protein